MAIVEARGVCFETKHPKHRASSTQSAHYIPLALIKLNFCLLAHSLLLDTLRHLLPTSPMAPALAPAHATEAERNETKSYADAVEQDPPAAGTKKPGKNKRRKAKASSSNGADGESTDGAGRSTSADDDGPKPHMAKVLRIVDTGVPEKQDEKKDEKKDEMKDEKKKEENTMSVSKQTEKKERPEPERQESKNEFSAEVCACLSGVRSG